MANASVTTESYERLRPLAFAIAYRMLGSVTAAEDVVQEAFLRLHRTGGVEHPRAFLTTVTTRLAIDELRSAKARRETYPGPWLPEPVVTGPEERDPESLSMALLVVLESLSPVERAVFLLHDVFDYGYDEIATIVGKSRDNCRQLALRARRHVDERRPRFDPSREQRQQLAQRFFAAIGDGHVQALVDMLAHDAVMYGDGGGKAAARTTPLHGAEKVARFLLGLARLGERQQLSATPAEVNGQPGAIFHNPDGTVAAAMCVDVVDGRIAAIRSVVNPDKLTAL